jgi:hypothetical protein
MPPAKFQLQIPIDASGIQDITPDQQVRVAAQDSRGTLHTAVVKLDARGQGTATLAFQQNPGKLRLALGPQSASAEEILGMQTVETSVPARLLLPGRPFKLPPIKIPLPIWTQWWKWCRKFTVTGRVLCANGRPVPGAKVCAYDIDFWWWWGSRQLVGCDTTDANGSFTISFKWCCGFLPWWWWQRRVWQLEPVLADHILPLLQALPKPLRTIPQPKPDLSVFNELLVDGPVAARVEVDPAALAGLRDRLVRANRLPFSPIFEKWKLWPWFPWQPWFDCSPDLIFRVTQSCHGQETEIVAEGLGDIRWNVPTSLNVTLAANDQACCLAPHDDDPEGACALLSEVCTRHTINDIGGNAGSEPAPPGLDLDGYYLRDRLIDPFEDRPFAGNILISGKVGDEVDYYGFESSDNGGATWNPIPPPSAGGFERETWVPPTTFNTIPFNFDTLDGRLVMESRLHYEATHPMGPGPYPWTTKNYFSVLDWRTLYTVSDGTHRLRIKGYKRVGDTLTDLTPGTGLPVCTITDMARVVLRIDNQFVTLPIGHSHPCGPGTVHACTAEPDTDVIDVRISGASVGACDLVDATAGGSLEIDFLAHDPDGHLGSYSLIATYDENLSVDLLAVPGAVLTALGVGEQKGPNYADALGQGATRPIWRGGTMRLAIPDLKKAFKKTCCYQLELRASKRTIVNCSGSHENLSQYSFMVVV